MACEDLLDERQEGIRHRATHGLLSRGDTRLRQHAPYGGVVKVKLSGDCAHGPVLGVIQPQDLRLELARDHCDCPLWVSPGPSSAPSPRMEPSEGGQCRSTERTDALRRWRTRTDSSNIDRLAQDHRAERYPAGSGKGFTSLMRHFSLVYSVAALPFRMLPGATESALIAAAGAPHTLTTCHPRTLSGAVDVAVVTLRADLHLHPAAAALIEPVGRLLEQPHAHPPKGTGQRPRGEA